MRAEEGARARVNIKLSASVYECAVRREAEGYGALYLRWARKNPELNQFKRRRGTWLFFFSAPTSFFFCSSLGLRTAREIARPRAQRRAGSARKESSWLEIFSRPSQFSDFVQRNRADWARIGSVYRHSCRFEIREVHSPSYLSELHAAFFRSVLSIPNAFVKIWRKIFVHCWFIVLKTQSCNELHIRSR